MDLIARVRRNTVGDALRRTAAKFRDREALVFGDRHWSFAALDVAADRVARRFADLGLQPGDRVAAYGRNSDAYLLAWLGCARAGLVHVPVNYALTGHELSYILEQSGARAVLAAPSSGGQPRRHPGRDRRPVRRRRCARRSRHRARPGGAGRDRSADRRRVAGADRLHLRNDRGAQGCDDDASGDDVAVLLRHPRDGFFRPTDRALAALPLYHTAQMHAFTIPQLLVGARTVLIEAPVPELVLRLIEQERITSFFAPPTVWISLLRHPDFATRDLRSLRESLLRRLDHAGAGAARVARAAAERAAVQLLRSDRDRPARYHAASGGTRRAPGVLRPAGAERGDPRGRSGHERRAAGHAWRDRAPFAASADRLLEQAGGDRGGLHRRLVSFR